MAKWAVQDKIEFEARQRCLEFGFDCRFVMNLVVNVKNSLGKWWKTVRPTAPKAVFKVWQQLVLEGDDFHQIVLSF